MKQLTALAIFGLFMIASCKCNNDEHSGVNNTDTTAMATTDATATNADNAANNGTSMNAGANGENDAREKMYDYTDANRAEITRYRQTLAQQNWGDVPGYFPEGSERALTEEDTKYLSRWGYQVMLNEIYARHGMKFPEGDIKDHFETQEWYKGTSNSVTGRLTATEKSNIAFLENHKPGGM